MKIILIIAICFLFAFTSFAQTEDGGKTPVSDSVSVEQIYLAKDSGDGSIGEAAESFLTTDVPIYCVVQLNSTKPATIKMNLVAVNVQGVKAESKVITVSYKTNGNQNRVSFTGKPDGLWTIGNYRIDVFVDDKPAGGQSFEIKKSPAEIQKTVAPTGGFVPPKPRPRPKIVKVTRKN